MSDAVWLVFIKGGYSEGETTTDVFKVFGNHHAAELCEKWVRANKDGRKIGGMWVDEVWVSDEYPVHEESKP
jgi:hypothetical protein